MHFFQAIKFKGAQLKHTPGDHNSLFSTPVTSKNVCPMPHVAGSTTTHSVSPVLTYTRPV